MGKKSGSLFTRSELRRTCIRNCLKSPSENSGAWILAVCRAKNVTFLPHFARPKAFELRSARLFRQFQGGFRDYTF